MNSRSIFNIFSSKRKNSSKVNEIKKLIDDCCDDIAIINSTDKKAFEQKLKVLAEALRIYFDSRYCAIGTIDEKYVEDCVTSRENEHNEKNNIEEKLLRQVKRVSVDYQESAVCKYLSSNDVIKFLSENELEGNAFLSDYEVILSVKPKNTTIIYLRDKYNTNKGFIQLINSHKRIEFDDIKSFYESLQRLILIIQLFIQRCEALEDSDLFKKDFDFFLKVQDQIHDVDELLRIIMEYLSEEFNAGIISFRIPLLNGLEKTPLFYLRECYIHDTIAPQYTRDDFFNERLVKTLEQMGGNKELRCNYNNSSVITEKSTDNLGKILDKRICFHNHALIIPILRDYSEKNVCLNPSKTSRYFCEDGNKCPYRFAKYFGIFKLGVFRNLNIFDSEESANWLSKETKDRLLYIAKHISILMNSIMNKYENESLDVFQKGLRKASFTRIKEYDEQCTRIVKDAVHTKICAIYRYRDEKFTLSASTNKTALKDDKNFNEFFNRIVALTEKRDYNYNSPDYFIYPKSAINNPLNSVMIVPMVKKDNSKLGVMVLVGKEDKDNQGRGHISKTFWEHDKKHIEFIVKVLARIEESDSERLTFLSQLSHELLRPITEMVYRSEYYISSAQKALEVFPKALFIKEMQNNVNLCMTFKYIIDDVEYIYSLSKGDVQYNFEMISLKGIILDAIRLFEEEASASKNLKITTYLSKMPEKLYVDKSRMTQVVINLLKNAIRYSDSYEDISIRYEFNDSMDCHEINFEDNGILVESEDKDRIFDLFARSKNAMKKVPNGSGIGLYLVKQIMKAHGGDCYVKKLAFPTIFTIQIPNK